MPGPLPKPDDARRRRNPESKSTRLSGRKGPVPVLPERVDGRAWDDTIVSWWDEAWRSPMASRWQPAEVHVLVRYCTLWQLWADACRPDRMISVALKRVDLPEGVAGAQITVRVEPDAALLSAMAAIEERFGLSAIARRRLNWELDDDQAVNPPVRPARRNRPTDPRLKVVEGGSTKGRDPRPRKKP